VASFETAEKEGEKLLRSCANVAQVLENNLHHYILLVTIYLFPKFSLMLW
jgi:hypothetical protein